MNKRVKGNKKREMVKLKNWRRTRELRFLWLSLKLFEIGF
jgi:hypothetical protein